MKPAFALLLGIIALLTATALFADSHIDVCGDANRDGTVNIGDAVYVVNYIFKSGPGPVCVTGTVTDIDGNVYHTIKIGEQWWMVENLKVTHYRNGDPIPNVTDPVAWNGLATGAYCEYDNDIANVALYGRLYNWFAVGDSRNIAPAGWHVPSDAEWQTVVDYLGGNEFAGGTMKDTGTVCWSSPNTGATNESGFTGLPGGGRGGDGPYSQRGYTAAFWTSTEHQYFSSEAWNRLLIYNHLYVIHDYSGKRSGASVRCVKD